MNTELGQVLNENLGTKGIWARLERLDVLGDIAHIYYFAYKRFYDDFGIEEVVKQCCVLTRANKDLVLTEEFPGLLVLILFLLVKQLINVLFP